MACLTKHQLDYIACETAKYLSCPDEEDITLSEEQKFKFKDRYADDGDGMGYVILRKNKTFAEQVIYTDTIYEIRYDFDLNNGSVTIPSECLLKFNGGSVKNGSVNLNNCTIDGGARFDSISFSGDIKNEYFDAEWIGDGDDIGEKVNYAQQYFGRIQTTRRSYNLATPINITRGKDIKLNSTFTYVGDITNLGYAINLYGLSSANIFIYSVTIDQSRIDYTTSRTVNFIGVQFTSCNNCLVTINHVQYFNENIRIQDINHLGCCYNHFWFGEVNNSNAGVRLYQRDSDAGTVSWVNENTIHSGRFCNYGMGSSNYDGERYAIYIGGPVADLPSYKVEYTDTYDQVNCISIEDCSFEGRWKPVYSRNCRVRLRIHDCREEDNIGLIKFVGENQLDYKPKYTVSAASSLSTCDFSEANWISLLGESPVVTKTIPLTFNRDASVFVPVNNIFNSKTASNISQTDGLYLVMVGCIVDTHTLKYLYAGKSGGTTGNMLCQYLDEDMQLIENMSSLPSPGLNSYYSNTFNAFFVAGSIIVPDAAKYVFIGGYTDTSQFNYTALTISSWKEPDIIVKTYNPAGSTRPTAYPLGVPFYDQSLSPAKPIWYTGSGWIDATGASV